MRGLVGALGMIGILGLVQGCSCDSVTSVASSMMKSKKKSKKKPKKKSVSKVAAKAKTATAKKTITATPGKTKVSGTSLVAGAAITAAGLKPKKYLCLCDVKAQGADKKLGSFEHRQTGISETMAAKLAGTTCKAALAVKKVAGECQACKCERKRIMIGIPKGLQLTE